MNFGQYIQNIQLVSEGIASLAALWASAKFVVLPVWRSLKNIKKMSDSVDKLLKEMTPNGGTSMKDAIRRIEERQIMAEERYKAHLTQLPDAIFECDATGKCIWTNRAYLRLTGRQMDEVLGNGWINAVVPADRARVFKAWEDAINQQRDFELVFEYETPNNEHVLVICQTCKICNHKGEVAGYLGTVAAN